MFETLINLFLLPYTFMVVAFKFVLAGAIWFMLGVFIKQEWDKSSFQLFNPFKSIRKKREKDYGDNPEDYIL